MGGKTKSIFEDRASHTRNLTLTGESGNTAKLRAERNRR